MSERRWRAVAMVLLVLALGFFFARGPFAPWKANRLWDYAVFASATELWVRGEDPYDNERVAANWEAAPPRLNVERNVRWIRSNAPPSTLVVLAPFGLFGRTGGGIVYLLATTALAVLAARRVGQWGGIEGRTRWMLYSAGLVASTPWILGVSAGNPIMLAAPLSLLAFERGRRAGGPLAGVLLGLAAAAKVQIGVPLIALAWLWRPYRRDAALATAVFAIVSGVGVLRLSVAGVDWPAGLRANIDDTNGPGGMNDVANPKTTLEDHLQLQARLWPIFHDRAIGNGVAWTAVGVGGFGLLEILRRRQTALPAGGLTPEQAVTIADPMILGVAAGLSLLGVYHRTYDALSMLPLIAAAFGGLSDTDRRSRQLCIAILVLATAMCIPVGIDLFLQQNARLRGLRETFAYRSFAFTPRGWVLPPIVCLGLSYLWRRTRNMYETSENSRRERQET